jgi:bifunctional DNA-binding transcriptional regulator/antitoxin component of YhaV-PrlF toxin-antitoxin module
VRVALQLAPGDGVEFEANGSGQFVVRKAQPAATLPRVRRPQPKDAAQIRRRAEELLALLRGLD